MCKYACSLAFGILPQLYIWGIKKKLALFLFGIIIMRIELFYGREGA